MEGLYFKYGAMNSSKSANMLMIRHNYESVGFSVILLKPSSDPRDGKYVKSRLGLKSECVLIDNNSDLDYITHRYDIVMVDECQFLTKKMVDDLHIISLQKVVMCFGLLTDFKRELFEGSKRLIELSDSIQEIKSICKCGKRAVVNARFDDNNNIITTGEQICKEEGFHYEPLCNICYQNLIFNKEV